MIILTARLPKPKFAFGVACATMVGSAFLVFGLMKQPFETAMSNHAISRQQNPHITYLESWGWQVDEIPLSTQTLLIPSPLGAQYEEYLQLQSGQGFPSLLDYQGKIVDRYTYLVTNYPSGQEGVQVNLLVYDEEIIAGEVLSPEINGFLHGLTLPD